MLQARLQRAAVRVDLGAAIEVAQHGREGGAVEALDLAVALCISALAQDEHSSSLPMTSAVSSALEPGPRSR
ncbi:MAG: hypothetical protein O3A25_12860 [Acidobacteria bacterium]|nr:hypothetical protein [Acidobacteriota bacterium]